MNYFSVNKLYVADVVHMTCKQQTTAKEDLKTVVAKLMCTDFSDSTTNSADSSAQSPNKKQSEVYHTQDGHTICLPDRRVHAHWRAHSLCSSMTEIKHCTKFWQGNMMERDQDMHVMMMFTIGDGL